MFFYFFRVISLNFLNWLFSCNFFISLMIISQQNKISMKLAQIIWNKSSKLFYLTFFNFLNNNKFLNLGKIVFIKLI